MMSQAEWNEWAKEQMKAGNWALIKRSAQKRLELRGKQQQQELLYDTSDVWSEITGVAID